MGSLGLPATAMAVRSAFALLCFALLCGLAASSVVQSETETELKEGEAAGNQVLVEQALESRVVRGTKQRNPCEELKGKRNKIKCRKAMRNRSSKKTNQRDCKEGKTWDKKTQSCIRRQSRSGRKTGKKSKDCNKKDGWIWKKKSQRCEKI